jgi:prophage DNA circulation protein
MDDICLGGVTLLPGSYKGMRFYVEKNTNTGGRRLETHKYPNAEHWYVEDLGADTPTYSVTAYLATQAVPGGAEAAWEALRAVCDTPGPGPLTLPPNVFTLASCDSFKRDWERDKQNYIAVEFEFIKESTSGLGGGPFEVGLGVAQRVISSVMGLAISNVAESGAIFFNAFVPSSDNRLFVGEIARDALAMIDSAVSQAVIRAEMAADVDVLFKTALAAVASFEDATHAPSMLSFSGEPQTEAMMQRDDNAGGSSAALQGYAPAAVAYSRMATAIGTYFTAAVDNISAPDVFAGVVQSSIQAVSLDPVPTTGMLQTPTGFTETAFSIARRDATHQGRVLASVLGGIAMAQAYADAPYRTRLQAQIARGTMVATLNGVLSVLQSKDAGVEELIEARNQASQAITARLATLRPRIQVEYPEAMPSIYSAWRLYRDVGRAQELAERNDAPHPLFMPASFEAEAADA